MVVMISSRVSASPRSRWQAWMMETMLRMAAEPEAGWKLKRSMPEISRMYRSRLWSTSRAPWTVLSGCRGCSRAIR